MRKHNILLNTDVPQKYYIINLIDNPNNDHSYIPTGRQTPSESAIFSSCFFTSLSSAESGGAISFNYGDSLTIQDCFFTSCSSTAGINDCSGGGAVHSNTGSKFNLFSSLFNSCSAVAYGGCVFVQRECESSTVSFCTFINSTAAAAGGLITYMGPSSSLSSSRFISCTASQSGGGLYHDSEIQSSDFTLSDSLFVGNNANYNGLRGGGACEDYRSNSYSSHYFFSFFTRNTAPFGNGNDISVQLYSFSESNVTHCFTTRLTDSFWNCGSYHTTEGKNWLPFSILSSLNTESREISKNHSRMHTYEQHGSFL